MPSSKIKNSKSRKGPSRAGSAKGGGRAQIPDQSPEMLQGLTLLGHDARRPVRKLETFPNLHPGRRYSVTMVCPEFTCVCPATGQPDFATITIKYIPDRRILESKSLKLYLWSFRNEGHFHEHVTNMILDDMIKALDPIACEITGAFTVRGGITITVEARYDRLKSAEDKA